MASWWSKLVGGGLAEPIDAIGKVIDDLHTSEEEKAAAATVMQKLRQAPVLLAAAVSKMQAAHRSPFVAGARPFIVWVCGFGLAFALIVNPILEWIVRVMVIFSDDPLLVERLEQVPAVKVPTDMAFELVVAVLGLGALRTYEKRTGAAK